MWLYDGNIGYLDKIDGRHIALFLASLLVFLFLFLPYTLFLRFGQCILPRLDPSKLMWLSWANYLKTKSFLDAYHAPYKDRHHYWIRPLLLVRFIVFLVSAIVDIESPQDPHVNLLMIIACNIGLAIWVWNGMYSIQELVPQCIGILLHPQPCSSLCCHIPGQTCRRKPGCSLLYLS